MPFGQIFQRPVIKSVEELRIHFSNSRDHLADDGASLRGRVADAACMRHRRCKTTPESVCTMVVAAATGRT